MIKNAWINITDTCNSNCLWCYEKISVKKNKFMPESQIYEIFDLLNTIGVDRCILIGGEPTLHPKLPEIFERGEAQGIRLYLISNGRKFFDKSFTNRMIKAGLKNQRITISMHASSNEDSKKLTRAENHFRELEQGIQNLIAEGIFPYINVTIAKPLLDVLETMMYQVQSWGLKYIAFNQGAPAVSQMGVDASHTLHPMKLASISKRLFDLGNKIGMKTAFLFNIPFCLLPKDTIDEMIEASAIISGCQVKSKSGILFNVNGELVLVITY